mmetsp:Transcript_11707/g.29754  ORF Transcript_11707/g.29754 Transcript_11707/m.29754 type:complete len:200 (-) Transcript_11707:834-1433(-)
MARLSAPCRPFSLLSISTDLMRSSFPGPALSRLLQRSSVSTSSSSCTTSPETSGKNRLPVMVFPSKSSFHDALKLKSKMCRRLPRVKVIEASPSRSVRSVTVMSSERTSPSESCTGTDTCVPTSSSLRRFRAHSVMVFSSNVPPWFQADAPPSLKRRSCSAISSVVWTCLGLLSLSSALSSSESSRLKKVVLRPSASVR